VTSETHDKDMQNDPRALIVPVTRSFGTEQWTPTILSSRGSRLCFLPSLCRKGPGEGRPLEPEGAPGLEGRQPAEVRGEGREAVPCKGQSPEARQLPDGGGQAATCAPAKGEGYVLTMPFRAKKAGIRIGSRAGNEARILWLKTWA